MEAEAASESWREAVAPSTNSVFIYVSIVSIDNRGIESGYLILSNISDVTK